MNRTGAFALLVLLAAGTPVVAQGPNEGTGTRVGVSIGGISTVGIVVEFFDDARSVELALGTWSFRDVSASAVVKQYFGAGAAQPFVGAGLWAVAAPTSGQRPGVALVLRAPIGVDWGLNDSNSLGAVLNVNRALTVRRSDPGDERPMEGRLVPLPEIYYRLTR